MDRLESDMVAELRRSLSEEKEEVQMVAQAAGILQAAEDLAQRTEAMETRAGAAN